MAATIRNRFPLRLPGLPSEFVEQRPTTGSSETVEGLTIVQATELLDWLEGHNIQASDVRMDDAGRMTVAWIS